MGSMNTQGGFFDRVRDAFNAILDGNIIRFRGTDGTNLLSINRATNQLGFFSATPATRPAAYTQTYSAASRTHPNATATTLTHTAVGGTADGTLIDCTSSYSEAAVEENFKELATSVNLLIADVASLKQVVNQIIDDLETTGIVS